MVMRPLFRATDSFLRARLRAREADLALRQTLLFHEGLHQRVQAGQHAPRLRRQLVQARAQHLVRDAVGQFDVGHRGFDVLDHLAGAGADTVLRVGLQAPSFEGPQELERGR